MIAATVWVYNWADLGGDKGGIHPNTPKVALCIISLQLQVMQALTHCLFNTNTAECQFNRISEFQALLSVS